MICFRVFVSLCQAALNLLDILGRWQLLWIYAPADEHIADSSVVVNMFLLYRGLSIEVFRLDIHGGHLGSQIFRLDADGGQEVCQWPTVRGVVFPFEHFCIEME